MRKLFAGLTLIAALALPGTAMAATQRIYPAKLPADIAHPGSAIVAFKTPVTAAGDHFAASPSGNAGAADIAALNSALSSIGARAVRRLFTNVPADQLAAARARAEAATGKFVTDFTQVYQVVYDPKVASGTAANALARSPIVSAAMPDFIFKGPKDPAKLTRAQRKAALKAAARARAADHPQSSDVSSLPRNEAFRSDAQSYQDAVDEIVGGGTIIVVSAGNDAGHAVAAPADCRGVLAVAALRHVGTKVGFSNIGPEVAIAAPGGNCVNTAPGTPCLYPILTTSNSGTTGPQDSIYTDSFNISVGTSFSAPLVSGTVALMLSAQPSLAPAEVKALLQATARPFPTTGADVSSGPVNACMPDQYDASSNPVDQLECYCTTQTCGAGMLDAGAAVTAAKNGLAIPPVQAQGLWWNAPAGSESGWGINFAHQGDVIFATWFTYDTIGRPWWLSMTATKIADNAYGGTLYQTRGPAFNAVPFSPSQVIATPVGTATVSFTGPDDGTFSYTVNGTTQAKSITRQAFGTLPTCAWGAQPNLALATNYQDLWWAAPAGSESGWGINLAEQSNIIFATWFTYALDGTATWYSMTATSTGAHTYGGQIYHTVGPHFDAVPFRPTDVSASAVGNGTLSFTDGNTGTFSYTLNGVSQSKPITRQVFRAPGTVCQ